MDIYEVEYDYCEGDSKAITRERSYCTGCWITVAEASIRHAEEYEKDLVSIRKVVTVTAQYPTGESYYPDTRQDEE